GEPAEPGSLQEPRRTAIRVPEQPVDPPEPQPLRRLAEQPRPDPTAPVGLLHQEVADVGPARMPGDRPGTADAGVDLDEAQLALAPHRGEPRPGRAERPHHPQTWWRRRPGQRR